MDSLVLSHTAAVLFASTLGLVRGGQECVIVQPSNALDIAVHGRTLFLVLQFGKVQRLVDAGIESHGAHIPQTVGLGAHQSSIHT